ncbi:MAG: hypothetical protein ACRDBH_12640 [Bosea sp. (in: a-proteobacteria)]
MQIDWNVLARQLALVIVPVAVAKGIVPEALSGPLVDFLAYVIASIIVAVVIWVGQYFAQPDQKIAAAADLDAVEKVTVKTPETAMRIPSPKVVT